MDFASSTRAAENRSRWKGIVANSSVVPRRPPKVMEGNRIEYHEGTLSKMPNFDIFSLLEFRKRTARSHEI